MASLANTFVMAPVPSPVVVLGGQAERGKPQPPPATSPLFTPTPILKTSPYARAYADVKAIQNEPEKFDAGSFVVGVAVAEKPDPREARKDAEPEPRIVVFGDSYLCDNVVVVASAETNLDLLSNAVNWLKGDSQLVGIAPKTHVARVLVANLVLRNRLIVVPTILSLAVVICMGVFTYLSRRE